LEDVIMLVTYFVTALVTGSMTARLRAHERNTHLRERRTAALYALTREVAVAATIDDILQTAIKQIDLVFSADTVILLAEAGGRLEATPHTASTFAVDAKELSVASWAFQNHKPAGRFTNTLPNAGAHYLPLLTPRGAVGVMGVNFRQAETFSLEQERLLLAFASQIALTVEREMLMRQPDKSGSRFEGEY
jgi:two-component system sensor histidine kinase KdpD